MEKKAAGVDEQLEDSMTVSGGDISLTLPQGATVNFRIQAELRDNHSFVIWEYSGFTTKTGEA